jgi:hypothetical protein
VADVDTTRAVTPAVAPAPSTEPTRGMPLHVAVLATLGGAAIVAVVAAYVWFAPFAVGTALGCLAARWRRARVALVCAETAALAGWAMPLVWRTIANEPVIATARVTAALAGLPPAGWLVIVVTLLLAAIQGLLGGWLATSLGGLLGSRAR